MENPFLYFNYKKIRKKKNPSTTLSDAWSYFELYAGLDSTSAFFEVRFLFFFFLSCSYWLSETKFTIYEQCMHYTYIVHAFKNIKNGFHDTIHTVKNYFATVFLVFSFQF